MCGIAGSINFPLDFPQLKKDLFHRGPDAQDSFVHNGLQFSHHRLSIVDIACGKQPMQLDHLTIIFNGEIYNHEELRKEHGLQCTTGSDTETLLHLYRLRGAAMLSLLDGMFAFAVFDQKNNQLFVARDRAGKKPLYFYRDKKKLVFASELGALDRQLRLDIDDAAIGGYLHLGFIHRHHTPYKNVSELLPGSYCLIDLRSLEVRQQVWWSIRDHYLQPSTDSLEQALAGVDAYLHTAVKRRLESSDLEVGSFLSGGIDSGLVTAVATEYTSNLKTFTVSFDGAFDEAPLARLVAEKYGTHHTEINISFDHLKTDIERILENYGEPFADSSAIPSYYVSREAKKHLTVILNGDGGDELFGGYRRYVPFSKFDFFKSHPVLREASSGIAGLLPLPSHKMSAYNYIYRLLTLAGLKIPTNYLSATTDVFTGFERHLPGAVFPEDFTAMVKEVAALPLSGLQKIMLLDFEQLLPGNLLVKMDIATMAHSLEGRSPLLAKELLEYVPKLSDGYKIRGKTTKYLLRTLAERYLPSELIHQPKRGFEIPLKNWVENDLKEPIMDYLTPEEAYGRRFFQSDFYDRLLSGNLHVPPEKRAKMLWNLFALEVWFQKRNRRG